MTRRLALLAAVALSMLVFPASSTATTNNYWGFNIIGPNNPYEDRCVQSPPGKACSGFNYWDYSQIDKRNGGQVSFGGRKGPDGAYAMSICWILSDPGVWTCLWSDYLDVHYHRVMCSYFDYSGSYIQCRALIFP